MSGIFEGDWGKLAKALDPRPFRAKVAQAAEQVGAKGASMVQEGIVNGNPGGKQFDPLHPVTVERKGSSKPLVNHSDLVGSITSEVADFQAVFIGVKKGTVVEGKEMVNIAAVHEFGCTIEVTRKMRVYLHSIGIHLKKDTTHIVIPERSFLRATRDSPEFREMVKETFLAAIKEAFGR